MSTHVLLFSSKLVSNKDYVIVGIFTRIVIDFIPPENTGNFIF